MVTMCVVGVVTYSVARRGRRATGCLRQSAARHLERQVSSEHCLDGARRLGGHHHRGSGRTARSCLHSAAAKSALRRSRRSGNTIARRRLDVRRGHSQLDLRRRGRASSHQFRDPALLHGAGVGYGARRSARRHIPPVLDVFDGEQAGPGGDGC